MTAWMLAWTIPTIALVVVGVGWLVRHAISGGGADPRRAVEATPEQLPYDIIRRRYAAGEIDEDEYLTRLSGLSQR